jgi:hypothetical protein
MHVGLTNNIWQHGALCGCLQLFFLSLDFVVMNAILSVKLETIFFRMNVCEWLQYFLMLKLFTRVEKGHQEKNLRSEMTRRSDSDIEFLIFSII